MKINILPWSVYSEYNMSQIMITGFFPNLKIFAL